MPKRRVAESPTVDYLAGWNPITKDDPVEVEHDPLTGGHYKVSCTSSDRAWIGLRGHPGVVSGAYCFEVKVTEGLLRVGWASSTASFALGTDDQGFGFGGTGKKSHRNKFADYGTGFEIGDVVTCCVDRAAREISFGINGSYHGRAFAIPGTWDGVPLFPALCAREGPFRATGYFGCPDHPKVPHGCGFWPMGAAYAADVAEPEGGKPAPSLELPAMHEPAERKLDRADRFTKMARVDRDLTKLSVYNPAPVEPNKDGPLVGRSRALERGYLRDAAKLCDPEQIRPEPVLREALQHALEAGRPWAWEAEMLRAIRQDLTVQHANAAFTEEVCEISALRALENYDWPTFAACAPAVRNRARSAELAWLQLLGSSALVCCCGLRQLLQPAVNKIVANEDQNATESATAGFVRGVLADMNSGRWTRALRRQPPTEAARQAHSIVVRPLAVAKAFAVATKAFPRLRAQTLRTVGVDNLPVGLPVTEGMIDGRRAHALALLQVEAAQRPVQRDDHGKEFLR